MKLNEIHRAPSFWGWVRKSAGSVGAILALWGAYDKVNDKIIRPIRQQQLAQQREVAEHRARYVAQGLKLDSILVEVRRLNSRRRTGR